MRLREKLQALRRYSVDRVLCVNFNARFAALEPEAFIRQVLIEGLGVRYLVVGDDFRFGHRRRGDFAMLQAAGREHGFQVVNLHSLPLTARAFPARAFARRWRRPTWRRPRNSWAGRFGCAGRVAHGDKLGRTSACPRPISICTGGTRRSRGIYAVELFGLPAEPLAGVASIGTRPTVNSRDGGGRAASGTATDGGTRTLTFEVHLRSILTGTSMGSTYMLTFCTSCGTSKVSNRLMNLKRTFSRTSAMPALFPDSIIRQRCRGDRNKDRTG